VWLPASIEVSDVGLSTPGRLGRPSYALSTTMPVNGATLPVLPPTAASNCAPVRTGSTGLACAEGISVAAMTAPVVLVLDDVHVLHNSECRAALSVLAHHVPAGSRLAFAGRDEPPL